MPLPLPSAFGAELFARCVWRRQGRLAQCAGLA
jgi:hypothetical protein